MYQIRDLGHPPPGVTVLRGGVEQPRVAGPVARHCRPIQGRAVGSPSRCPSPAPHVWTLATTITLRAGFAMEAGATRAEVAAELRAVAALLVEKAAKLEMRV